MIQCSKCGRSLTLTETANADSGHCEQCAIESRALRDEEKRPAYIGLNRPELEKGKDPFAGLKPAKKRGDVLLEAHKIINGQRQDQYGNPEDSFRAIARLWNAYIGNVAESLGCGCPPHLTSKNIAEMMALMKIARMGTGAGKDDNAVDCCGYIALAEDIRSASVNHKGGMA